MNLLRIPLAYRTKKPVMADWQKLSPEQLDRWCQQAKDSEQHFNWGVRLDGLVVVDCDTPEAVARWEKESPVVSMYQSRGRPDRRSYWYQLPPAIQHRGVPVRAGKMWHGEVDIKTGPGHQMVIPPSVHPDGHKYAWCGKGGDPTNWNVLALPLAPVEILQAERFVNDGPEVERIAEGCRDTTLTAVAGAMRRYAALSEDGILRLLDAIDALGCDPPVGHAVVVRIAHSVAQYPTGPIECVLLDEEDE